MIVLLSTCTGAREPNSVASRIISRSFMRYIYCTTHPTHAGKTGPLHRMEVLFPEYFQSISRIFPNHGEHFHTMELDKTIEIGFLNISILWKRSNFSRVEPLSGTLKLSEYMLRFVETTREYFNYFPARL